MDIATAQTIKAIDPGYAVVCPYFKDDTLEDIPELRELGGEQLAAILEGGIAKSTLYEVTFLPPFAGNRAILLVGAGDRSSFDGWYLLRVTATASRYLTGRGCTRIAVLDRGTGSPCEFGHAVAEGAIRGTYSPGIKKSSREERRLDAVALVSPRGSEDQLREGANIGQIVGEASTLARDLINLPPNDLNPSSFAERAAVLARENGLECETLDENDMRERGMGALLGVAAGSAQPPRLIVLRGGRADAATRLALVGKGITFDSGGLSLKTHEGMETMKGDMGGGAAVVAGMVALARLGLGSISVTGYVGATENMPGGNAMRPGDVLTAMNGETIEVLNTDAEGRLVLADVLSLARESGATHILDFATLTGGAAVALGRVATLATGKPGDWVARVVEAAGAGLERAWQMPLYPEYRRAMDSDVADIKNTGGRHGSALTAAAFLSDFVGDTPWAHMDIAGTSFADPATPFQPKGGTGVGVGTIVSLVRQLEGR